MIEKNTYGFKLICDICGNEVDGFDTFQEAVEYKKDEGWRSQKVSDGWEDICPECQ